MRDFSLVKGKGCGNPLSIIQKGSYPTPAKPVLRQSDDLTLREPIMPRRLFASQTESL